MADDKDTTGLKDRIECGQDDDAWFARDTDTGACGYGMTEAEALRDLIEQNKKSSDKTEWLPEPNHTNLELIKPSRPVVDMPRVIRSLKTSQFLCWRKLSVITPFSKVGVGAFLSTRKKTRTEFNRVIKTQELLSALALSDSDQEALENLRLIIAIIGCAQSPALILEIWANQISHEKEIIGGLQTSIKAIDSYHLGYKADRAIILGIIGEHQKALENLEELQRSPLAMAGKFAKKGAASNNPEGAARGAIARALFECIPPAYAKPYALISHLLKVAGTDATPSQVRRLVQG